MACLSTSKLVISSAPQTLRREHRRPMAPAAAASAARPLPSQQETQQSRRSLLSAAAGVLLVAAARPAAAAVPVPAAPQTGDCTSCIGEVNETLNTCNLDTPSCISTLNDDEGHFAAPWMFDGDRDAAVARLVEVATGGDYAPGLIDTFGGIRQLDAAGYIAKGVLAVATGGDMPAQPKRQRKTQGELLPFDGQLVARKTLPDGAEYIRVVLGTAGGAASEVEDVSSVMDAEFLFLADDNIVNVRCASRVQPEGGLRSGGQLALSFTQGLMIDKNVARRQMESLRQALRWELAPVITEFDPQFSAEAPVFVEKLFNPFSGKNSFQPSGYAYPSEGGK
ncbi:hypothetical protein C2E20_3641 [Micractinium conductrix]|uniref:Uncharacterized protein n=1 Tax=Micractinium conductrix TaxID=554055 RepID=A0A2P6VFW6_9CHLO|nr:hypothetical protein C2E20_3641 [Micractinium conductrix]|eukprot:PSC72961.1 hypothetical protein C2E20_3641 [Micractinium conductrix]